MTDMPKKERIRRLLVLTLGAAVYALLFALGTQMERYGATQPGRTLARFLPAFCVAFAVLAALMRCALPKRLSQAEEQTKPFRTWLAFLLIFACYVPIFLIYYPGTFAYDTQVQAEQVVNHAYTQFHPLAHTLFLGACLSLFGKLQTLEQCAAGFVCGLALCALPIVIWLAARGALSAAWYGSIVHNMLYTETGDTGRVEMLLHTGYGFAAMLMAAFSCAGALALRKKSPMLALGMVAAAAAGGLAAFLSRKFYDHYLILGAPMAVMGLAAVLAAIPKPRMRAVCAIALTCCCALWLGVQGKTTDDTRLADRADWAQFTANAQTLMAQVPEDERGRFMAYRVEPRWYVAAEALPCMRFYFLQEVLAQADPAVMDEIVETFETDPPKWLVIYYNRAFNPPYDARVAAIFETDYEFVDAAGQYQLLRLKE